MLPTTRTPFPYTTLFRSVLDSEGRLQTIRFSRPTEKLIHAKITLQKNPREYVGDESVKLEVAMRGDLLGLGHRSEEHTSELQSRENHVCRLLLEKKKQET